MQNRRYVKLNNGAIIDIDNVAQIVRKDINEYGIVTQPAGVVIRADSDDVKFVESKLAVEATPQPEKETPKIEVAE